MAKDGPGLMQGDDASYFCEMVYVTISDKGSLSIDELIESINKGEPSRRDEYLRLVGEFIDVACNGSIKKEMYSCYSNDNNHDDPDGYVYGKLKTVRSSRKALETVLSHSQKCMLRCVDPVLSYQEGYGQIGKNLNSFLRELNPSRYAGRYDLENKAITEILEYMLQDKVLTMEDAKKHREKILTLYNKMKMIGCSQTAQDELEAILHHGWFREENYKNEMDHLRSNINNLKDILQKPDSEFVIYRKDDPQTRLRNPYAEYGLAKVIKETNDILWDHEIIPRAEFKKKMQAGRVNPSNMYISGGRLYEMTPSKIVEMYFNDLMDIYFNQWIYYSSVTKVYVQRLMSGIDELNNEFFKEFMITLKCGSIFDNLNNRLNNREQLRQKYPDLFILFVDSSQEKGAELQKEFFKQLKIKMGHDKPCIVLTVSHPRPNDDYQLYFCMTTMSEVNKTNRVKSECIKVIEI